MTTLETLQQENKTLKTELASLRSRLASWTLLGDLITRVSATLETTQIGAALLEIVWQLTGAECNALWFHPNPNSNRWDYLIGPEGGQYQWLPRELGSSPVSETAETGKAFLWREGDDRPAPEGVHAYIALPLTVENRVIAVLEVYNVPVPDHMAEYVDTLRPALPPVALALHNAQLYHLTIEQNQHLEARVAERTTQIEAQQEEDVALFCHLSGFSPLLYNRLMQVFPDIVESE